MAKSSRTSHTRTHATSKSRTARHRHVTHAVRHHYNRVMPAQSHHRAIVWVVFLCIVGIVAAQMLYPLDRAVPLARLGKSWVGWQLQQATTTRIQTDFERTKVAIDIGDGPGEAQQLSAMGASVEAEAMASRLQEYPFWQRFIPLSIFWQLPRATDYQLVFNSAELTAHATTQAAALSHAPTNANLELRDGKLIATNEAAGRTITPDQMTRGLQQAHYAVGVDTVVRIVGATTQQPQKKATDLDAVRAQAEAALARPVTLRIRDEVVTPTPAQRASWLILAADESGKTVLGWHEQGYQQTIAELNTKFARSAGQTHMTMVNGVITSRIEGTSGEAIDAAALANELRPYLLEGQGQSTFTVGFAPTPPQVIYNNRYTATQEGLQAYARDQAAHGAWISIRQIGGNGWAVDADADQSIPSASTFKLFVAKELFDRMNAGQIGWSDPILDTTVSGCFDRMTIASTNPCAREWLSRFGRTYMNEKMWSLGFSRGTSFTNPQAVHTTAGDLTRMMVGIENGSLMSGANRDRLYRSLSTHPYRYGIPTGSKATKVYDKVGFLWDYVHDTAIVYHPRGTYVMTIMTKGKSYAAIARMTREIEALMYP